MKFTTFSSASDKKLATNLGIGLLVGGVVLIAGSLVTSITAKSDPITNKTPSYVLPVNLIGVTCGIGASISGVVLLGLGIASKVN